MANDPSPLTVTSTLFSDGGSIPKTAAHSMAGGENISPDLSWSGAPGGTVSLAITCHDPDAPTTVGFTHWVLFNLDASTKGLEAGAGSAGKNPAGSVLGYTDWGSNEYGGMAPPPGDPPHHYNFTVYALDTEIGSGPTTTLALLEFQMGGHILAQGRLTGLFAM
jgi:Raf kinase inhibitor-like YbhB/YbcL family protein